MKVLEGECSKCFGNVALNEATGTWECEDCDFKYKPKNKPERIYCLAHSSEWGPKESRQLLTLAGTQILASFQKAEPIDSPEGLLVQEACRGLINDGGRLEYLRKGGFIF